MRILILYISQKKPTTTTDQKKNATRRTHITLNVSHIHVRCVNAKQFFHLSNRFTIYILLFSWIGRSIEREHVNLFGQGYSGVITGYKSIMSLMDIYNHIIKTHCDKIIGEWQHRLIYNIFVADINLLFLFIKRSKLEWSRENLDNHNFPK